ncbi:MAG: bacillithiol system redox-active protein YtxJ [Cyclobacteriaceae bacterium]|nr:bacillithiol system redox-active protein YtxJ [Cyclobacteriaceae bacterium]
MNWINLTSKNQLENLIIESTKEPVIIFKHSTACSISRATLDRLERNWKDGELTHVKPYFLDLLSYREISNSIAENFDVEHQSPQVLIISNGKSVFDRSHFEISFAQVEHELNAIPALKN